MENRSRIAAPVLGLILAACAPDPAQQDSTDGEDRPPPAVAEEQAAPEPLFREDFQSTEVGAPPDEDRFMVLEGEFTVREEAGNRFAEVPGAPLSAMVLMFGPAEADGITVSARIQATRSGRRYPRFGVGTNGITGYQLRVVAGRKSRLELVLGEDADEERLAETPFEWTSGSWTRLALRVRKTADGWAVEGRAWPDGAPQPAEWAIRHTAAEAPRRGRPTVRGPPYAGTPIRFDDLEMTRAGP